MQQFIIIEPSKAGAEHLTFNASIISALLRRAPGSAILAAEISHFDAIGAPNIPFFPLPIVSIVKRKFVSKVLVEAFALAKAFIYAKRRGIQYAIVLSVFPPLLSWLAILAQTFGISTTLIMHGELEGLVDSSRQRITSFGYWVKRFFVAGSYRKINCIVLSEGIHRRLVNQYPAAATHIQWANHPIAKPAYLQEIIRDINFATVGVATDKKHSSLFSILANLAHSGQRVAHIGMTEPELFNRYKQEIEFFCPPGAHLSQAEFGTALERVIHAIFPYAKSSYRMTVSGAMLDAIACGCRVVCLPNDFADELAAAGMPVTIATDLQSLLNPNMETAFDNIPWDKFSADAFCEVLLSNSIDSEILD